MGKERGEIGYSELGVTKKDPGRDQRRSQNKESFRTKRKKCAVEKGKKELNAIESMTRES
jgi:hypothetical protein